jgi:hypothetical protein
LKDVDSSVHKDVMLSGKKNWPGDLDLWPLWTL